MSECSSLWLPLGYTSLKSAGRTLWWKLNSYNKCTGQGLAVDVNSRKNGRRGHQDIQWVLPWQNNNLHKDANRCIEKKTWSVLIKKQTGKIFSSINCRIHTNAFWLSNVKKCNYKKISLPVSWSLSLWNIITRVLFLFLI